MIRVKCGSNPWRLKIAINRTKDRKRRWKNAKCFIELLNGDFDVLRTWLRENTWQEEEAEKQRENVTPLPKGYSSQPDESVLPKHLLCISLRDNTLNA